MSILLGTHALIWWRGSERLVPPHHKDPFDRMLVAQAQSEGLVLMTADPWVRAYDVRSVDASL